MTWAGFKPGLAPRMRAAAPATWGAAAEVPENSAQPSVPVVPSPLSPEAVSIMLSDWSNSHPGCTGNIKHCARGCIPTKPHTVGTISSSNQGLL